MKKIIFLVIILLVGGFYFITDRNVYANDYYDAVNEKFFSKDNLGDDKYIFNTFTEAQEESDKVRDLIIDDIVNGNIKIDSDVSKRISILYNNVLDKNERDSVSIGILKKYIDMIMNSSNIGELISNGILVENELGVDIFTRIEVDKDFIDNSKLKVYLYPVTFAFGTSSDYYIDEDYMAYKAYVKRAIINILQEYGYSRSEARLISSEVVSFYTEIGNSSKLSSSYEDVTSYYNVVDLGYLSNVYDKMQFSDYLKQRGIDEDEYSLVDEGQYRRINEFLTDEYLILWKKVILVEILSSYASYVDSNYYEIVESLNNSLAGIEEDRDYLEDAVNLVGSVFSSDIDVVYDGKVISSSDKEYLRNLFNEVKGQFKKTLKENTWLSDETKTEALIKLEEMKVYVGLDNKVSDDSNFIEISGDDLVSNIISINKSSYQLKLKKLRENDISSNMLSLSEVNAYYSPMDNAVYIPSSVMFLMDSEDNYYKKLGTVGMIIAHEVTHGFDYNGSLFDSKGNLNNWWNDEDRVNYTKLKRKMSEYYSKIEVIDGMCIDGDKTVNENIADMGALKIISGIAKEKGASEEDFREMYLAFGQFWKTQVNDSYAKLLLLNDNHSPNKYRVNAVLSSTLEFYEVYRIYPWNDMYVSSKNRVSVW